jgi:hypothetical protein
MRPSCRHSALWFVAALVAYCAAVTAAPQGKGKPTGPTPGILSFRCPTGATCLGTDGIVGDGADYTHSSTLMAALNSNGEMRVELLSSARSLTVDFTQAADAAPCLTSGPACRYWSAWNLGARVFGFQGGPAIDGVVAVLMQTNVVDAAGNEVANGLLSLPPGGAASNSRFSVSFQDPDDRDMHWVIRFYPELYAGSNYVKVRRETTCEWTIGANPVDASGAGAIGGLLVHDHRLRGKSGNRVDHGLYVLPFELTFKVPSLCPAS